jgi:hypothetical protein
MPAAMANVLDYFLLEPLRLKHLGLWKFRVAQVLHERTNGGFDDWYVKRSRRKSPPGKLGAPQFVDTAAIAATVAELDRDGCSILPRRLADADIQEIADFAFSTDAYAADPKTRIAIRPSAIPRDTARHVWDISQIIRIPAVQRLLLDPAFHQIAQDYLKAEAMLSSVTLWIDAPSDKKFGAHQYHYDNDGPGFLKFFFYLTDVEPDTGAHCFIKGTHGHRKPEPFKLSTIYQDDVLHAFYGQDKEIMFAAPKGTIIAEDTAGFHRGSTVLRNHRLLMQFQYSVLDIPSADELDGRLEPVKLPQIPPELRRILSKHFVQA